MEKKCELEAAQCGGSRPCVVGVGEVWLCHNTSSSGRTGDLCGGSLQRWEALTDIGSCCHQKQRTEGQVLFRPVDTWVALSVRGNQCDAAILKTRFGQPEVHSYDTCALSNFLLVRKERKVEDGGGLAGKSLLLTDRRLFPVWRPEGPRGTQPEQPGSPTALGAALHTWGNIAILLHGPLGPAVWPWLGSLHPLPTPLPSTAMLPPNSPAQSQRPDSKRATACALDPTSVSLPEDVGTCGPQAQAGLPRPLCGAPCYFFTVWSHTFLLSRDHPELLSALEPADLIFPWRFLPPCHPGPDLCAVCRCLMCVPQGQQFYLHRSRLCHRPRGGLGHGAVQSHFRMD